MSSTRSRGSWENINAADVLIDHQNYTLALWTSNVSNTCEGHSLNYVIKINNWFLSCHAIKSAYFKIRVLLNAVFGPFSQVTGVRSHTGFLTDVNDAVLAILSDLAWVISRTSNQINK